MHLTRRGVVRLLVLLALCGQGCNERLAATTSGGESETGGAKSSATAGSSSADGPTACGEDGVAVGLFLIRENSDAEALRGCHTLDGEMIIDPCQTCADPSRVGCTDCVEASLLTSIEGLESLREVTGSLAVGLWLALDKNESLVLIPWARLPTVRIFDLSGSPEGSRIWSA